MNKLLILGILIIVVVLILFLSYNQSLNRFSGSPTTSIAVSTTSIILPTTTVYPIISIVGNSQVRTVQVTNQSELDITGNSENITVEIQSNSVITIKVIGNSNIVNLINGKVNVTLDGNYNIAYVYNATVINQNLIGNSDRIINR